MTVCTEQSVVLQVLLLVWYLKGNCHELRMHLSKFVCGNMPGFLSTFHSWNVLFCLELSLSPPKARHMQAVFPPCIDAALNQT